MICDPGGPSSPRHAGDGSVAFGHQSGLGTRNNTENPNNEAECFPCNGKDL
jgi:hypothetical protein